MLNSVYFAPFAVNPTGQRDRKDTPRYLTGCPGSHIGTVTAWGFRTYLSPCLRHVMPAAAPSFRGGRAVRGFDSIRRLDAAKTWHIALDKGEAVCAPSP